MVKSSGIDFAILRAGYGQEENQKDKKFEINYTHAVNAGIPVGIYLYSYALTVTDAEKEAKTLLKWLNGRSISYPVYFDMEDADSYKTKHGMPTNQALTEMCDVFCEIISAHGYQAGVYANTEDDDAPSLPN